MKRLIWLFLLATAPVFAQNYTFTAPHLTMHAGDLVPPCPILVLNQTTGLSVGEGKTLFTGSGYPTCSIGATSTSPVGTYPITVSTGNLTARSGGTITLLNSSIDVIAPDDNGAKLNDSIIRPPGFTSGPAFPAINVTSNPFCQMHSDNGATDNRACLQYLLTLGGLRAKAGALVSVNGTAVTGINTAGDNMNFTTIPVGTSVKISGVAYTVASVTNSSALTLATSAGIQTSVILSVPTTVNTSGTTVTATNGISFTGITGSVLINGLEYQVASVTDPSHIVTTTTLPTQTGVDFWISNITSSGYGASPINLYFPGGTYWIGGRVLIYDNYWSLYGDGPQKSVIRLAPNAPTFNTGQTFSMITAASIGGNDNFSETISDMGFRIGPGNPNAYAIQWLANNIGTIKNVQIVSEDSNAAGGVYLGEPYVGPTLLKDLAIYGTLSALTATSQQNEYSITADEITLEGQQSQGCLCDMTTSFQHVLSDNDVTAFLTTAEGRGTLIDSELISKNPSNAPAINIAAHNQMYFKNVSCTGYMNCEIDNNNTPTTRTSLPPEGWSGNPLGQSIFDTASTAGSLPLADTETPIPADPAGSTWTQLGSDPTTWCTSITNSTSTTVYLPPGVYSSPTNLSCSIPDTVNHILMYNSSTANPSSSLVLTFNIAGSSATPLTIDGCLYKSCQFNHTGMRTLVLRNTNSGYQAANGAGNLYMENTILSGYNPKPSTPEGGPTFFPSQFVTARQLNIELGVSSQIDPTNQLYPKIQCQGASLWILGYKTEQNSPSLIGTAHCQADLYGFWFYNLQPAASGEAPIVLTDSSLFATGFLDWNVAGNGATNWVNETRNGVTQSLPIPGSSGTAGQALQMFYSYGASPH